MSETINQTAIEVQVNFLYPGIVLKGDAFIIDGTKFWDGSKPFTEEAIAELKAKGYKSIFYTPPSFTGKSSGKKMMLNDEAVRNAVNVTLGLEEMVKKKAPLPMKEITSAVDSFVRQVSLEDGAILNLLELKNFDDYTYTHSVNVSLISILMGKKLNYTPEMLQVLGVGGLLHDIGKILIPLEILNKPSMLSEAEFTIMKKHPAFGYEILKSTSTFSPHVQGIVLYHHEKTNGMGYPFGKRGEEMGEMAQLVSLADVFDALTTARSYKPARPFWFALMNIFRDISISFAPRLANTFVKSIPSYLTEGEVFPKGSFVTLNTGEVAEVIDHAYPQTLWPVVEIFYSANKEPLRSPARVILESDRQRTIENVIESPAIIAKLKETKASLKK